MYQPSERASEALRKRYAEVFEEAKHAEVTEKALWSVNIYRGMPINLPKAMEAISWTADATHRFLTFFYMFVVRGHA